MKNGAPKTKDKNRRQKALAKKPDFLKQEITFDENHPALLRKKAEAEALLANNKKQSC